MIFFLSSFSLFFFFNATATTEIYTLSLHDALPICSLTRVLEWAEDHTHSTVLSCLAAHAGILHLDGIENARDRKSTRLNSSHVSISYAVFCLKKKKKKKNNTTNKHHNGMNYTNTQL